MYVSINRADFQDLKAKCEASDQIKAIRFNSEDSGVIDTPDVSFEFHYDWQREMLYMQVGKRHSLAAKVASDNIIYNHLMEVVHNLEPVAKEVTEKEYEEAPVVDQAEPLGVPVPNDDMPPPTDLPPNTPPPFVVKPTVPQGESDGGTSS